MLSNILLGVSMRFPHLGIEFSNVGDGISVFGFKIAYYGMIIAFAMIMGYALAQWQVYRTKQSQELYLDYAIIVIISAIIGARAYYVIFSWDEYKDSLVQIFNLRGGGLAIYGGIIGAVIATIVFAIIKKVKLVCDKSKRLLANG